MNKPIEIGLEYIYRRGGRASILCVNRQGTNGKPVISLDESGCVIYHTVFGWERIDGIESPYDLLLVNTQCEIPPDLDFKRDEPVMVSEDGKRWMRRHFACYRDNRFGVYDFGTTSWCASDSEVSEWPHCRRPSKEELES